MKTDMKRFIARVLLVAFAAGIGSPESKAAGRKVNSGDMASLVREYNLYQGFDVVSVGGLGLGLVKMIAKASAENEEDRMALEVIDGLRKIIVVDYMAAEQDRKDSFSRKAAGILKNAEKIIEVLLLFVANPGIRLNTKKWYNISVMSLLCFGALSNLFVLTVLNYY